MCGPHLEWGVMYFSALSAEYLQKLFETIQHRFVFSLPLIYSGIYLCQYGLVLKLFQFWPSEACLFGCCVPLTYSHYCGVFYFS